MLTARAYQLSTCRPSCQCTKYRDKPQDLRGASLCERWSCARKRVLGGFLLARPHSAVSYILNGALLISKPHHAMLYGTAYATGASQLVGAYISFRVCETTFRQICLTGGVTD